MIFIFSAARSGSTWLGKLFDSHPDVLYLHEPDISDRGNDLLPFWTDVSPSSADIDRARRYLTRLRGVRNARTVGIRPFFPKSYRGRPTELVRQGMIYAAKALEQCGLGEVANRFSIPDLAFRVRPPRLVQKSVSALGRAEAFLAADATIIPLLLIRHPCGFVASMLRGAQQGIITRARGFGRMAETRSARRLGLNETALYQRDDVAFLAWSWLISNTEAHSAIPKTNGLILNYDQLAADPAPHVQLLFERLGLGWPEQVQQFIKRSQQSEGDYYSVFRDSGEVAERWKVELDASAVKKIRDIVERDPLGTQFFSS